MKYCFDTCPHNKIKRHSFETTDQAGRKVSATAATEGTNKPLMCELGYKQTAATRKGLVNSEANGTTICPRLHKVL